jgi:hypothetical protein
MSEFQYYEWHALDRPLSPTEMAAVRRLSSHIDVSSTRAQVDYSWGSFKHNEIHVLTSFFDAFLYASNWGTYRLALRYPAGLLDEAALQPYLWEGIIDLTTIDNSQVLDITYNDEEGGGWVEAEGALSMLAPLRADLLAGDYRCLYLAWLMAATSESHAELPEPPVPPGLGDLNAQLSAFVDFFALDPMLVQATARASAPLASAPQPALDALIARLPRAECNEWLQRIALDEPLLSVKLRHRLQELSGKPNRVESAAPARTLLDLVVMAEGLREAEAERKRAEAAARRKQELLDFAPQAAQAWREIDALMEKTSGRAYDQAADLLVNLRDVAVMQNDLPIFAERFAKVQALYGGRQTFMARLRAAGLLDSQW